MGIVIAILPPHLDQPAMIGANDVTIRDICSGVVMLVSNRAKCGWCTPDITYCHR
jgi:hypothetical protein